jgi:hypothetical protein
MDQGVLKSGRQIDRNVSMKLGLWVAEHVDVNNLVCRENGQQFAVAGDVGTLCRPWPLIPIHPGPHFLSRLANVQDVSTRDEGVENIHRIGTFV